jgi:uncharacterized membrane protein YbhN (UPF0104 family)
MKRRLLSSAIAVTLTVLSLWLLLTPALLAELRMTLARANWWMLAIAMLLCGSVQWLRALRFAIMRSGVAALPDPRLVRIAFQLNFFNFILPFRLGELSYPVLMNRAYGESPLRAAGTLLLARLLDLASVGAILLGSAAWLRLGGSGLANSFLAATAIMLILLPLAFVTAGRRALDFTRGRDGGRVDALASWFAVRHSFASQMAVGGLSFGIWLAFGAVAILTTHAVVVPMSPVVALLGASATNLAFALPINGVAGLGPSQAAWAATVNLAGVPWGDAVATAFILHAVVLASALLFGGIAMMGGNAWARGASPPDCGDERATQP